jgi:tetratricopeptide (TPR) repeat protein
MLETLRQYALEQLSREGEVEEAHQRHAAYYASLAERAEEGLRGPAQATWLARLEREYSNIRAALEWASEHNPEVTVRIMFALRRFWYIRGHIAEGGEWLQKALERGDTIPPLVRAKGLRTASTFAEPSGDAQLAIAYLEESGDLARQAGDKGLYSEALSQLGYVMLQTGNRARAKSLFEESLVLDREVGNVSGVNWLLTALGEVARADEDYDQARIYYEEALSIAREEGNNYYISHLVGNLSSLALIQNELDRAAELMRESLILARELEYRVGIAGCVAMFGSIAAASKQNYQAVRIFGAVDRYLADANVQFDAIDERMHGRYLALARAELGEEARKAWEEGRAMTIEEAVAYVEVFNSN